MVELKLVQAPVAGAPGPEGQPYLDTLSCPVYDSLTKLAVVVEGEEEAPARIVECAQRTWAKAEGWCAVRRTRSVENTRTRSPSRCPLCEAPPTARGRTHASGRGLRSHSPRSGGLRGTSREAPFAACRRNDHATLTYLQLALSLATTFPAFGPIAGVTPCEKLAFQPSHRTSSPVAATLSLSTCRCPMSA